MTGSSPKSVLERHGLRPKKGFGQNFLVDRGTTQRIAELATTPPGGSVLELGAGLGALTIPLGQRADRVLAVERDRDLILPLQALIDAEGMGTRVQVLEQDAKGVDVARLLQDMPRPWVLAGNLPYQLTGPLLRLAVEARAVVDRVVFLVQLEVAERLGARPGEKVWGGLSVFTQAAFEISRPMVVKRGAFYPSPRVDSAIIVLTPRAPPLAEETSRFRMLVSRAFAMRRKTLRNAWRSVDACDDETLARLAHRVGIDLNQRGETLEVAAFARMAEALEAECDVR
jgi:16S rRNA (adenine1518-N6/adenine1519-N6)-dimethyltransferase